MDDALRPAPDASYEAQLARPYLDGAEQAVASAMIGRPLRSRSAAAVRCRWGLPAVLRVDPRLDDGTPFPTVFYLTCPTAASAVGRLEAAGVMREMSDRLSTDPDLASAYERAHVAYLAHRSSIGEVPEIAGKSAGGMPTRVKCLHVLVAHALVVGPGVNPLGDEAMALLPDWGATGPCVHVDADRGDAGTDDSGGGRTGEPDR